MRSGACLPLWLAAAAASSLLPSLSKTAQIKGDSRMAAVACCGADRSATVAALGATKRSGVAVLEGPTTLALLDGHSGVIDSALAVAASQVVLLEVRVADLVERGPNGLAQLLPLLQRSVRLCPDAPKKLLVLAVVDHEPSDASEGELNALAAAQLEQLCQRVKPPEGADAPAAAAEVFELQCCFLPHPKAEQFGASVEQLKARFTAEGGTYLFAGGRYSTLASSLAETADALAAQPAPPPQMPSSPADVSAAYACGLASDAATKDFQKGLGALRKAAEASLLPDFGERAASLLADALERYDAQAAPLRAVPAFAAARGALRAQLRRALLLPYRKQLVALQKQTLAKFRQKLSGVRPSAEVEAELGQMLKELKAAYEQQASHLADASLGFDDAYERRELYETFAAATEAHVENLRVQGLYIPLKSVKLPIDFSAHWLGLNPFGKDARYDALDSQDRPLYKPQATPMKLALDKGYPMPRVSDPKRMVFTDQMMK